MKHCWWWITKEAVITNTGLTIKVPGFVEVGDEVVINTETFEYMKELKNNIF